MPVASPVNVIVTGLDVVVISVTANLGRVPIKVRRVVIETPASVSIAGNWKAAVAVSAVDRSETAVTPDADTEPAATMPVTSVLCLCFRCVQGEHDSNGQRRRGNPLGE